jgi:hypothetical protein
MSERGSATTRCSNHIDSKFRHAAKTIEQSVPQCANKAEEFRPSM